MNNTEKYDLYSELIGTFWIRTNRFIYISKYGYLLNYYYYFVFLLETDENEAAEYP